MNRRIFPPIAIGAILIIAVLVGTYFRREAWKVAPSASPIAPLVNETQSCYDSDNGKDIYVKGSATTKRGEQVLHINSDSCATQNKSKQDENEADYIQGLAACSGWNCFVHESFCGEVGGNPLDEREFIQCLNGCNNGACVAEEVAKSAPVDVSNWQAYSDAKNNFEFKYPPGFMEQKAASSNSLLYLEKDGDESLESIHVYWRKNLQIAKEFPESKGKLVDINGRSVYKYFFQEGDGYSGVALIQLDKDAMEILYDILGEEKGSQLTKEELVKTNLNQIISTFKFADVSAETVDWQTYRNEKYGFEITFPESWKGYIYKERVATWGIHGESSLIDFGMPSQSKLFVISMHDKKQWKAIKAEGGPTPDYITESDKYVFGYSPAQDIPDKAMVVKMSEVPSIIKTFKVIN